MEKKTIVFTESVNYFGDDILTFPNSDEHYNMFQHNCRGARDFRERVSSLIGQGCAVLVSSDNDMGTVTVTPALPYVERIIKLNDEVNELECVHQHSFRCDGAGAEIASKYGY